MDPATERDLTALVIRRINESFNSVAQLMEDDDQLVRLHMATMMIFAKATVDAMHAAAAKKVKFIVPRESVTAHLLEKLAEHLGLACEVVEGEPNDDDRERVKRRNAARRGTAGQGG